ncbi:MAG TPA: tRNA guanosine(34) transglycosylase Tgt [Bryobacteraceae bacterium]|nr:tRNA guanosine(34) transglycosylase Tgt [Bryobacteraceae bacterium]
MSRAVRFELLAECSETRARAGLLHTAHGPVPTPVFMPVGTQATVKGLTPSHLADELDARIVLANTYHLYIRPGHVTVKRLGGLHRFMNWHRAILTDSGGFQVFSLNDLRRITEDGVKFQSHLDGSPHMFTPESVVDIQLALGSDIAMVLDECIGYPTTWQEAKASTDRTLRWARRSFDHYGRQGSSATALFPIVQGGVYGDLRRANAEQLLDLDADGYAVGGLSVGEPREASLEMAEITTSLLPPDRPRYVMGVGLPEELAEYVARGVDMVDCVLPSRNARHGKLFTSGGAFSIKNAQFKDDAGPVDPACSCYTCRNFSRAYLRHLFLAGEQLFVTLATLHNLRRYLDIMREMRDAIINKAFPSYLTCVRTPAAPVRDAAG